MSNTEKGKTIAFQLVNLNAFIFNNVIMVLI